MNTDQQLNGLQAQLVIDRDTAGRLGVPVSEIDNTLNDAFGQRQVSNIYKGINQYHVVLEVEPQYLRDPETLKNIYAASNTGKLIPLSSFSHFEPAKSALTVNHQGIFPGDHSFLQSRAGRVARARRRADRTGQSRNAHAADCSRHVPGNRAGVSGFALKSKAC